MVVVRLLVTAAVHTHVQYCFMAVCCCFFVVTGVIFVPLASEWRGYCGEHENSVNLRLY
jgi:hypothetical protein